MPIKTEQLTLTGWRGLNRWDPETEMNHLFLSDCLNVEFDEEGTITKRRGAWAVDAGLSGDIWMIGDWQKQEGFGDPSDNQRTLVIAGSTLYVIRDFLLSPVVDFSAACDAQWSYMTVDDVGVCFISNENGGIPKMLFYTNELGFVFQSAALASPDTAPLTTIGDGNLTGTFSAIYTWEDIWGNESGRSPTSFDRVLDGTGISVYVNGSADPSVKWINIYVRGPGSADYQYVTRTQVSGWTNLEFTLDELYAADFAPTNVQPMPPGRYVTIYEDMLLIAGNPNVPDSVWCSDRQFHRMFSDNVARVVTGDGQPIIGFGKSYQRTLVVKTDSVHLCEGEYQDLFRTRLYTASSGALGQGAVSDAGERMVNFSDDGFYVDGGGRMLEASRSIRNLLRTFDPRNLITRPSLTKVNAYPYYRQVIISSRKNVEAEPDGGPNNINLVWNWERDAWSIWQGNVARCMGLVQGSDDYEFLYGGDGDGNLWLFTPPNLSGRNDDMLSGTISTPIESYVVTPWMNFAKILGKPDWERTRVIPRYLKMYVSGESQGGIEEVSLTGEYWVDFNHENVIATFDMTFTTHAWPEVRPYEKTIYYGGKVGTFRWIKWKFSNDREGERYSIHKMVFGFKLKPSVD